MTVLSFSLKQPFGVVCFILKPSFLRPVSQQSPTRNGALLFPAPAALYDFWVCAINEKRPSETLVSDGLFYSTSSGAAAVFFPQDALQVHGGFTFGSLAAQIAAVGLHLPCEGVVFEGEAEAFADDALFEFGIFHGGTHFDAAEEVAPHPVGAGDVGVFFAVVIEVVHA